MSRILTIICIRHRRNFLARDPEASNNIFVRVVLSGAKLRAFFSPEILLAGCKALGILSVPRTRGHGASRAWQARCALSPASLRPHSDKHTLHMSLNLDLFPPFVRTGIVCCTWLFSPLNRRRLAAKRRHRPCEHSSNVCRPRSALVVDLACSLLRVGNT